MRLFDLKGVSIKTPGVSLGAAMIAIRASKEVHLTQSERRAAMNGLEMTGKAEQRTVILYFVVRLRTGQKVDVCVSPKHANSYQYLESKSTY